ncbi:MAG TPA: hypothetical protein VGT40_10215 [Methylomirabilota bacterium]|nr:hypothetical protein [Methylomirabilota bacterium]
MRLAVWLLAVAALGWPGSPLFAEESPPSGRELSVPLHSRVEVRALPAPAPSRSLAGAPARAIPRRHPDPAALESGKQDLAAVPLPHADATIADPDSTSPEPAPRGLSVLSAFDGPSNADNAALAGFGVLPPDSNIGAGPSHLFQAVNLVGRISDKAGTALSAFTLRDFFALDPNTDETDPRVLYDASSGRWFATYLQLKDAGATGTSSIVLAVSISSDPTGGFCRYRVGNPTTESFIQDFPQLGVSDDKVVISYNGFAFNFFGTFQGAGYYVINKSDLTGCAPSLRVFRIAPNTSRFTVLPAQSVSSTSTLFLAMSPMNNGGSTLTVFGVTGVPGESFVSEAPIPLGVRPWSVPPNATQPGSSVKLATNDNSAISAVWRANSLWIAGNEGCTPPGDTATRSCLRLIEVRTDSSSVRQDMTIASSGQYYYFPAVSADVAGNIALVFTASSATDFAGVRVTGRYAGDPLNTVQPSTLVKAGGGAQTSSLQRMGDYAGAAVDPADPSSIWVMGEYIQSSGSANWGTYVGRLRLDTATLAAAVLPSSRSVQVGAPATAFATVINTGSSPALGVGISLNAPIPATFSYQTTDSTTNAVTGSPNTPADIGAGGSQSYVVAITPTGEFAPTDVAFVFAGINTTPAGTLTGVNTLLLSASASPVPDVVALAATATNDGIIDVPAATGVGAFAVATVNVGASALITVSADTGGAALPVTLTLCQTNPATGQCISAIAPSVTTQINAGETPTFATFVGVVGTISFDPAVNRIFVRFKDPGAITRGSTSVAVRTQ